MERLTDGVELLDGPLDDRAPWPATCVTFAGSTDGSGACG